MGCELVSEPSPLTEQGAEGNTLSALSYTEIFREHLPYYLSIGMTYQQYYYDSADLVIDYRKAEEYRSKRKNQELWLQGLYVYNAIGNLVPVLHAFAGKGAKAVPYPDEPFPITQEEIEDKQRREAEAKFKLQMAQMHEIMSAINKKRGEEVG